MRKFEVVVNGNKYEVEIQEIAADGKESAKLERQVVETKSVIGNTDPESKQASGNKDFPSGQPVKAPIGGIIRSVRVKEGDTVGKGDLLMTLEAMKMENEITSSVSGKVVAVNVSKDASVSAGDTLVVIA